MAFKTLHSHKKCRVCGATERYSEQEILKPYGMGAYYCTNCDDLVYTDGVSPEQDKSNGTEAE